MKIFFIKFLEFIKVFLLNEAMKAPFIFICLFIVNSNCSFEIFLLRKKSEFCFELESSEQGANVDIILIELEVGSSLLGFLKIFLIVTMRL